jgi:hypothetical protein
MVARLAAAAEDNCPPVASTGRSSRRGHRARAGFTCCYCFCRQSERSEPVSPAHLLLEELAPEELSLEDEPPGDALLGDEVLGDEVLGVAVLEDELLGEAPLEVDSAGEGDEAPPALELELVPLSLPDDPPPALLPLAPTLAPPPAPALPPPAPPAPCAHDTVARPNMAAVIAALTSLSFIACVPLGLGWDELRGHPRKNNAPGSNGLSPQGFSAR